jgi:hypothetical protein
MLCTWFLNILYTLIRYLCLFQNTVTNAEKLLAAADELAQTGECHPKEIYREAQELQERMESFLSANHFSSTWFTSWTCV